jgi:hypothetical protein
MGVHIRENSESRINLGFLKKRKNPADASIDGVSKPK